MTIKYELFKLTLKSPAVFTGSIYFYSLEEAQGAVTALKSSPQRVRYQVLEVERVTWNGFEDFMNEFGPGRLKSYEKKTTTARKPQRKTPPTFDKCSTCDGEGHFFKSSAQSGHPGWHQCEQCRGTGIVPVYEK